jgi:hypothetical protein
MCRSGSAERRVARRTLTGLVEGPSFASLPLGVLKQQLFVLSFLFCCFLGVLGGFASVSCVVVFFVVFELLRAFVVCCLVAAPGRVGDPMIEYPGNDATVSICFAVSFAAWREPHTLPGSSRMTFFPMMGKMATAIDVGRRDGVAG